jgi:ketosteroid isomerase-like protein
MSKLSPESPPLPQPRSVSLTRELTDVEAANLAFYEAFNLCDVNRMEQIWAQSPYVRCIHPGWEPVVGWPYVRQSWADIFESMDSIDFKLEDVHVEVVGESARVNLVAHASVKTVDNDVFQTTVVATTIFDKIDDQWLIVLHHSSHLLEDDIDQEQLEGFTGSLPYTNDGSSQPN